MTSKIVESNDGIFQTAVAVAPVTDWIFYGNYLPAMILLVVEPIAFFSCSHASWLSFPILRLNLYGALHEDT